MAVQVVSSATFISTMLSIVTLPVLLFTRFIDSDPVWLYIEGREIITKTSHKEKVCFN
ncbi:CXC chemokine [Bacillus subtilis subsp. subtilis str. RO-NN-1]|uniref:hypothetical protein n=1 Tax=Bacillus subtilis TaxID=1423 RepID=UPI00022BB193|nr:hypothetical protein [Bacillus subtilis]AEP90023.1 CXC chemokine [Bacillus subtilis subsp. subtilis str. RO-NN-1]MCY8200105.1 hypothetical protein [Bacillus subtilis]